MISPVTVPASNSTTNVAPPTHPLTETKAPQASKKDPVDISKLAQKLASDGDTQAQEFRESNAEKASEKLRNKA
jgi:hypothetical protein